MKNTQNHSAGSPLSEDSGTNRSFDSVNRQLRSEALLWRGEANNHIAAGDNALALAFLGKALSRAESACEPVLEAELHNAIGSVLSRSGDIDGARVQYALAVACLEHEFEPGAAEPEVLKICRYNLKECNRGLHARTVNHMLSEAKSLLADGATVSARRVILDALPYAEYGAADPILEAELLNQLAWTYGKERDLGTGVEILRKAQLLVAPLVQSNEVAGKLSAILADNTRHFEEAQSERPVWALIEQADDYIRKNLFEHGEAAAEAARTECRTRLGADHPSMAYALHRVGYSQLMMRDFAAAKRNLYAAANIISKWPVHEEEARTVRYALKWVEQKANEKRDDWPLGQE